MKTVPRALVLCCVLMLTARAQSNPSTPTLEPKKEETSPLLIEANELSVQVVQFYKEGKFDQALPPAKRALELRESALGREHALVAEALNNLGALYLGKRKYGDSESAFKRALGIYEKLYGAESVKLCSTLENLCWVYVGFHNFEKAEDSLQRSLLIKEKVFGEESEETGRCLITVARFYQSHQAYTKAALHYQRAFAVAEKLKGIRESELAVLATLCADALNRIGQTEEAKTYVQRASAINEKQKGNAFTSPSPLRVGGLAARAIHRVEPAYSFEAREAKISGSVVVEVVVSETGRVLEAKAISGHPLLKASCEQAAAQWVFAPTLVGGKPAKVSGTITFNFNS
jgi:TonB family protein